MVWLVTFHDLVAVTVMLYTHTRTRTRTHTHTISLYSHNLTLPGPLLTLSANPDSPHQSEAAVQLTNGTVLKYTSTTTAASNGSPLAEDDASNSLHGHNDKPPPCRPSLTPWLLNDGREMRFPDTCCEHVAMVTFKDEVQCVYKC